MTQADDRRAQLAAVLADEKRRLWNELRGELFSTLGEDLATQYDLPQDIGDRGIMDLLSDTGLALADMRREELTRMEEALHKLEDGTYGVCEDCGEGIAAQRLRVNPYAACCLRCQELRESNPASPPRPTL